MHGWDTLRNGELLDTAEAAGFEVRLPEIAAAVDAATPGSFTEVEIPLGESGLPIRQALGWILDGMCQETQRGGPYHHRDRRDQLLADLPLATSERVRSLVAPIATLRRDGEWREVPIK